MKALLIVAHGSRREASNDEVRNLTQRLFSENHNFDFVDCAFLEIAEPSIPLGLESCVTKGAKEVVVMPYFLAAGRHVVEDIPEQIAQIKNKFVDVQFQVAPHLGESHYMGRAILDLASEIVNEFPAR